MNWSGVDDPAEDKATPSTGPCEDWLADAVVRRFAPGLRAEVEVERNNRLSVKTAPKKARLMGLDVLTCPNLP